MNDTRPPSEDDAPVWVLASYRAGENSQLVALAEALQRNLGLHYQVKRMHYRPWASAIGLARRVGLGGIDHALSSPLQPPWPRLVITAGLRNEAAARWIGRQGSGACRTLYVGRCWAPVESFDLVVTTPQYRTPPHAHVLLNDTTMQNANPQRLRAQAARLGVLRAELSGPFVAVMMGGHSGPYCFGPRTGAALGRALNRLASERAAALLISTSARTPPDTVNALAAALEAPHRLYRWRPDDPDNPYFGYLGLAAEVVVTGDSIAMLSEACATGKPVHIFDLAGEHPATGAPHHHRDWDLKSRFYALLMHGPKRLSRDLGLVHRHLIDAGHAQWLGDPVRSPLPPPPDDVERTVHRVAQLLAGS